MVPSPAETWLPTAWWWAQLGMATSRTLVPIRELKPEAWRMPGHAKQYRARTLPDGSFRMTHPHANHQRSAFLHGERSEFENRSAAADEQQSSNECQTVIRRSRDTFRYVAFDQIRIFARAWAKAGTIDRDLLPLLDPPDADSLTEALATGLLPAFGICKRTGEIVPLPPSTWRMEVGGFLQSLWAIRGDDIVAGLDGDPCLPVVTRADLARALQATSIPPDPPELPSGWQPAAPIPATPTSMDPTDALGAWMLGYAEGFRAHGRLVKRDEAVHAAMESRHCTSRQAEAAYSALPYPDLRNPPRTQSA